jgi:nucleoside-diphosphate-sugar epimerase
MKKILITGGAGFIGLSLAKKLASEDFEVHLLDNFSRAVIDDELSESLSKPNVKVLEIDLTNKEICKKIDSDYTYIFHLAAIIGVSHVLNNPYAVLTENLSMLMNMIEVSKKQKALSRFFFSSTSEVYAGTLEKFDMQIPTPEDTPLTSGSLEEARSTYMLSKIYGEAICHHSGVPFTIFRPHNVYGPRMGMSHVIPEQLLKAHNANANDTIEVFSPSHTRSFCYIDDAVEFMFSLLEDKCEGLVFNLGSDFNEISMLDLVKICHDIMGKKLSIIEKGDTTGSPTRRAPDISLAKNLLGYQPIIPLEIGVEKTYTWYKKNVFNKKEGFAI